VRTFNDLITDRRQRRAVGESPPVLLLGADASVELGIGARAERELLTFRRADGCTLRRKLLFHLSHSLFRVFGIDLPGCGGSSAGIDRDGKSLIGRLRIAAIIGRCQDEWSQFGDHGVEPFRWRKVDSNPWSHSRVNTGIVTGRFIARGSPAHGSSLQTFGS
jgi:pimeloyl-ACP methyl ester carboxylesterase